MIDSVGYLVVDETMAKASYKGYCKRCYHSFWKNEIVRKNSAEGFVHLNCLEALADQTPRMIDPRKEWMFSGLDKAKLKKKAKKALLAKGNQ